MTAPKSLCSQCLRELKVQSLQALWEDAKVSFESNRYQDANEDLTAVVAEIEQNVLAVALLKRALSYSCQGRLEAGIKDAYRVMKLAPNLFEGYFCAGNLLQLTGEYGKAVAVYTEGIDAVSGQSLGYEQLVGAKRAVEDYLRATNTVLFKRLPFELLAHIFGSLLSFSDRIECMFTCHSWQDFLCEDLPRSSRQVVLGNMPKGIMDRLSETMSASHRGDLSTTRLQTYQVAILSEIPAPALDGALRRLSKDGWRDRISYLDIYAKVDSVSTKPILDKLLQQNGGSLKRLIMCNSTNIKATVEALDKCSKLSHLVVATSVPSLTNNTSITITHSGMVVTNASYASSFTIDHTAREPMIASTRAWERPNPLAVNPGPNLLADQQRSILEHAMPTMGQQPGGWAALVPQQQHARMVRMAQQALLANFPQVHHTALKRLELLYIQTGSFVNCNFWERLPNLEHIFIKSGFKNAEDLRSIAQNVGNTVSS